MVSEMPEDIRATAADMVHEAVRHSDWASLSRKIADAILAERARCAKIAEAWEAECLDAFDRMGTAYWAGGASSASTIASAIRSPAAAHE